MPVTHNIDQSYLLYVKDLFRYSRIRIVIDICIYYLTEFAAISNIIKDLRLKGFQNPENSILELSNLSGGGQK